MVPCVWYLYPWKREKVTELLEEVWDRWFWVTRVLLGWNRQMWSCNTVENRVSLLFSAVLIPVSGCRQGWARVAQGAHCAWGAVSIQHQCRNWLHTNPRWPPEQELGNAGKKKLLTWFVTTNTQKRKDLFTFSHCCSSPPNYSATGLFNIDRAWMNLGRNLHVSNWPSRELLEEYSRRSWVIKLNWFYNEA